MRLTHNLASLNIFKEQSKILSRQSASYEKISSGYKINRTKDDPNGIAKSERLRMHIKAVQMANRNVQDGVSMLQTAEGAVGSINDALIRIRELAVSAENGTNTPEDREIIQGEIKQIMKDIDGISAGMDFNGVKLIGNEAVDDNKSPAMSSMPIGNNPDDKVAIPMYNLTSSKLLDKMDVTSSEASNNPIEIVDNAIDTITSVLSKYGALENRFENSYENLNEIGERLESAESSIRDVDIAEEMIEFAKNNILVDTGNALMAQTNRFPQDILRILENVRG